jgi:hypothetical protein
VLRLIWVVSAGRIEGSVCFLSQEVFVRSKLALFTAVAFACLSTVALAGGRPPSAPSGFDHPPSDDEIRGRLRDICTSLVIADGKKADVAGRRCGCYSKGVVKAMTAGERDEMRVTGKFAPSAQPKAKKFMASCRING